MPNGQNLIDLQRSPKNNLLLYNFVGKINFHLFAIIRRLENEKYRLIAFQKEFYGIVVVLIPSQPDVSDVIHIHVDCSFCHRAVIRNEDHIRFGDDHFAVDFNIDRQVLAWESVQHLIAERAIWPQR